MAMTERITIVIAARIGTATAEPFAVASSATDLVTGQRISVTGW